MLIEVTQEDIDSAYRCSISLCPLAKAMTRTLGYKVAVGGIDGWWNYDLIG